MPSAIVDKKCKRASIPTYGRIEQDLLLKIRDGRWPSGMMLPGRKALSEEYGVSVGTIQLAIASLLEDGYVRSESRRGTFVNGIGDPAGQLDEVLPLSSVSDFDRVSTPTRNATIGILSCLVPDQMDPGNVAYDLAKVPLLKSLERGLSGDGRITEFRSMEVVPNTEQSLRETVTALIAQGVNGLAFILEDRSEVVEALLSVPKIETVPVVWISSSGLDYPIPHVYWNNSDAAYEATCHIIRQGYHRKLVFFAPFTDTWVEERIDGVRKAMKGARLDESCLSIWPTDRDEPPTMPDQTIVAHLSAKEALAQGVLQGAGVIAANDIVAVGILQAADEAGLVSGVDFGLIGFDDHPKSCLMGLSTVSPPLEALGQEAASLLLRAMAGERVPTNVRVGSNVVPRASTKAVGN